LDFIGLTQVYEILNQGNNTRKPSCTRDIGKGAGYITDRIKVVYASDILYSCRDVP
jgi:hypothetical protein